MKNKFSELEFKTKAAAIAAELGGRIECSDFDKTAGWIKEAAPFDVRVSLGYYDRRLHFSACLSMPFPDGASRHAGEFTPWNYNRHSREQVPDSCTSDPSRPASAIAKQIKGMIGKAMPYWDTLQTRYNDAVDYKNRSSSALDRLRALVPGIRESANEKGVFYVREGDKINIGGLRYMSLSPENAARLINLLIEVEHE